MESVTGQINTAALLFKESPNVNTDRREMIELKPGLWWRPTNQKKQSFLTKFLGVL